mmetsp:Transcript_102830/g.286406  ORF Transcript_102830/g.286406 Transcript_102830/m.286406 type:complete len:374 (+) Transcript_102830:386-1507(+)
MPLIRSLATGGRGAGGGGSCVRGGRHGCRVDPSRLTRTPFSVGPGRRSVLGQPHNRGSGSARSGTQEDDHDSAVVDRAAHVVLRQRVVHQVHRGVGARHGHVPGAAHGGGGVDDVPEAVRGQDEHLVGLGEAHLRHVRLRGEAVGLQVLAAKGARVVELHGALALGLALHEVAAADEGLAAVQVGEAAAARLDARQLLQLVRLVVVRQELAHERAALAAPDRDARVREVAHGADVAGDERRDAGRGAVVDRLLARAAQQVRVRLPVHLARGRLEAAQVGSGGQLRGRRAERLAEVGGAHAVEQDRLVNELRGEVADGAVKDAVEAHVVAAQQARADDEAVLLVLAAPDLGVHAHAVARKVHGRQVAVGDEGVL